MNTEVRRIVDGLGSVCAAARTCEVTSASIAGWLKRNRLPAARRQFLRLLRPDLFPPEKTGKDVT